MNKSPQRENKSPLTKLKRKILKTETPQIPTPQKILTEDRKNKCRLNKENMTEKKTVLSALRNQD